MKAYIYLAMLPLAVSCIGANKMQEEFVETSPKECLVIEDSKNGSIAAKAAGMSCYGFYNPDSGNQDLSAADFIFYSYDELKAKLTALPPF